jgi:hypothetical protein
VVGGVFDFLEEFAVDHLGVFGIEGADQVLLEG